MGISTGSFYPNFSTLESLQISAQAGFSYVEIVLQGIEEHSQDFARYIGRYCKEKDIHPCALHPRAEFFSLIDYQDGKDQSVLFNQMIQFATELRAELLVFHGPKRGVNKDSYKKITEGICRMAKVAKDHGLQFTLENSPSGFCTTPLEMQEILEQDTEKQIGIALDYYKARSAGFTVNDFLATLPNRICHFHYCDMIGTSEGRLLPGQGNAPITLILSEMESAMRSGYAMLEASGVNDITLLKNLPLLYKDGEVS